MKLILSLLLFSNISFAIDEKAVLEQLMGIHGANWNALAKNQTDFDEIKKTLQGVINGDLDLSQYGYTGDVTADLVQSATSEYGNFVSVNPQGQLSNEDKEIIRKLRSNFNTEHASHDALAYYELLKNTGSVESLDLLSESLLETQNLSTLYTIERSLHLGLLGEQAGKPSNLDNSYIKPYKPHLKKSWKERPGDWKNTLSKINQRLLKAEEVVRQKSQDQRFLDSFTELREKIEEVSKAEDKDKRQVLIENTADDDKTVDGDKLKKDSKREISGVKEDIEESGHRNLWWLFGFFGIVLIYLIRSAFKR